MDKLFLFKYYLGNTCQGKYKFSGKVFTLKRTCLLESEKHAAWSKREHQGFHLPMDLRKKKRKKEEIFLAMYKCLRFSSCIVNVELIICPYKSSQTFLF